MAASSSSSQSYKYDVFLSFRGDDTRKTFVDYLYSTLDRQMIYTYKDDVTLPRGDSIRPSLFNAIEESKIAIIVFSENYADSSWCLEELTHIMKCRDEGRLIVMPIFYCVDPSDVRKQKRKYGEAFAKHDKEKSESWRKALVAACEIAGWDPKNIANGHEMKAIEEIVDTVSKKLLSLTSDFDEDLVGISVRVEKLEAQLELGSGGVRMVGIWGVGGSGKTTLASSLCMKISHHFQDYCIVENIREESSKNGLKHLQEKIISRFLKTEIKLQDVQEGKRFIRSRLSCSTILVILDDVDHIDQLDALVGSHSWFGNGSRIIITTRDEQLLKSHKVDRVYPATLLSHEEAIQLFNKRAYDASNPIEDYETLSSSVISYAAGLPLALKVLGSFLCGRDEEGWRSALARLKRIPDMRITEILKISYDGLTTLEKQLFLDIACFFRRVHTYFVTEIFEACGYDPGISITVLKQKALITTAYDKFDMHDLVQEMGHYIVRGDHPDNPEKHSRVWEYKDITYLASTTMKNKTIEALEVDYDFHVDSSLFYKVISSLKKLRWLRVYANYDDHDEGPSFLSNELRYIYWNNYPGSPFPDTFQPMKLVVLRMSDSYQKELWKGYKHLPHLKVLRLSNMMNLLCTPDFDGLPRLQELELIECNEIIEIHSSLGSHTSLENIDVSGCLKLKMFPTIVQLGKLETLQISNCHKSLEFPEIKSNMESLVNLSLYEIGIDALLSSIANQRCPNLISLDLYCCFYFNIIEVNFDDGCLKHLEEFTLKELHYVKMPDHVRISLRHQYGSQLSIWLRSLFPQLTISLQKLVLSQCDLRDGEIPSEIVELSNLRELDLTSNTFTRLHFSLSKLSQLKLLDVSQCERLLEFPELPSRLAILRAEGCFSLKAIGDCHKNSKLLCKVLVDGGNINDGSRFLGSMLEGNVIENNYMLLKVEGSETVKGFMSPLLKGIEYRLQLPENWCSDYSGFLMCAAMTYGNNPCFVKMEHVMSDMEFEDDVVWEESHSDKYHTHVWYVSFASLKHTRWWDETSTAVLFSIVTNTFNGRADGFGVRLVTWKSGSGPAQASTTQEISDFSHYTLEWKFLANSANALTVCIT